MLLSYLISFEEFRRRPRHVVSEILGFGFLGLEKTFCKLDTLDGTTDLKPIFFQLINWYMARGRGALNRMSALPHFFAAKYIGQISFVWDRPRKASLKVDQMDWLSFINLSWKKNFFLVQSEYSAKCTLTEHTFLYVQFFTIIKTIFACHLKCMVCHNFQY